MDVKVFNLPSSPFPNSYSRRKILQKRKKNCYSEEKFFLLLKIYVNIYTPKNHFRKNKCSV